MRAGVASRAQANIHQRHRKQPDCHLLAGRYHDVEFARIRIGLHVLGKRDEPVRLSRHRRDHNHKLVSLGVKARHAASHIADSLGAADRRAAVLLDD